MLKALVTGSSGFVGNWLARTLIERGVSVFAFQHRTKNSKFVKENCVETYYGDIQFFDGDLHSFLNKHKIDTVFHLAAQALVGEGLTNPLGAYKTNALGTLNVIASCRGTNVQKIVVASTDKVYGDQSLPYTEESPLLGRYPYDASKVCADVIAQSYQKTYGMDISILRCGNIFGGRDLNWSRIVPEAIRSCYRKEPMVIRSDGYSMLRDYVYIEDAVEAYTFVEKLPADIFNVSYGQPKCAMQLLTEVQEITGVHIDPIIVNDAPNEIDKQFLWSTKIEEAGWRPYYNFHQGMVKTVEWYYDYLGGKLDE